MYPFQILIGPEEGFVVPLRAHVDGGCNGGFTSFLRWEYDSSEVSSGFGTGRLEDSAFACEVPIFS